MKSRTKWFVLKTLLAGAISTILYVYTPTFITWKHLQKSITQPKKNLSKRLNVLFSPNSGLEVLPLKVQRMLVLIKGKNIKSYRLSRFLAEESLIKQRITEAAWPIRLSSSSPYLLSTNSELRYYPKCMPMGRIKDVTLARCH